MTFSSCCYLFRMNLEISCFDVLPAGFSFISKLHQNENSFQPRKYIQLCWHTTFSKRFQSFSVKTTNPKKVDKDKTSMLVANKKQSKVHTNCSRHEKCSGLTWHFSASVNTVRVPRTNGLMYLKKRDDLSTKYIRFVVLEVMIITCICDKI